MAQSDPLSPSFARALRWHRARLAWRALGQFGSALAGVCLLWQGIQASVEFGTAETTYWLIAFGTLASLLVAAGFSYRRPEQLALELDRKLSTHELFTTALSCETNDGRSLALKLRAARRLNAVVLRDVLPSGWHRAHLALLAAGIGCGVLATSPRRWHPESNEAAAAREAGVALPPNSRALAELQDTTGDPQRQARLQRISRLARQLAAGAASAPTGSRMDASALQSSILLELQQTRQALRAPSAVLALFDSPGLRAAQAALASGDADAFDRSLQDLTLGSDVAAREEATSALRKAIELEETNRVLATLLKQAERNYSPKAPKREAAPQPDDSPPSAGSHQTRLDALTAPSSSGAAPQPRRRVALKGDALPTDRTMLAPEAATIAGWQGPANTDESLDPETPTLRRRPSQPPSALEQSDLAVQQRLLEATARSFDSAAARRDPSSSARAPAQDGNTGEGPAGSGKQRPSAGSQGAAGDHAIAPRASGDPARLVALGVTPRLDAASPRIELAPGRVRPEAIPLSLGRTRTPVTHPVRPELLESIEHTKIPLEYREQVRRYFAP